MIRRELSVQKCLKKRKMSTDEISVLCGNYLDVELWINRSQGTKND